MVWIWRNFVVTSPSHQDLYLCSHQHATDATFHSKSIRRATHTPPYCSGQPRSGLVGKMQFLKNAGVIRQFIRPQFKAFVAENHALLKNAALRGNAGLQTGCCDVSARFMICPWAEIEICLNYWTCVVAVSDSLGFTSIVNWHCMTGQVCELHCQTVFIKLWCRSFSWSGVIRSLDFALDPMGNWAIWSLQTIKKNGTLICWRQIGAPITQIGRQWMLGTRTDSTGLPTPWKAQTSKNLALSPIAVCRRGKQTLVDQSKWVENAVLHPQKYNFIVRGIERIEPPDPWRMRLTVFFSAAFAILAVYWVQKSCLPVELHPWSGLWCEASSTKCSGKTQNKLAQEIFPTTLIFSLSAIHLRNRTVPPQVYARKLAAISAWNDLFGAADGRAARQGWRDLQEYGGQQR